MNTKILFSIGTSNRSEEEFIGLLREHWVTTVFDIRSKRGSRVLHFDETRFGNLSAMLIKAGISYSADFHESLGGLQNGKMTVGNFRAYAKTNPFKESLSQLKEAVLQQTGYSAILCCERDPKQCHRSVIVDVLRNEGWCARHILDTNEERHIALASQGLLGRWNKDNTNELSFAIPTHKQIVITAVKSINGNAAKKCFIQSFRSLNPQNEYLQHLADVCEKIVFS